MIRWSEEQRLFREQFRKFCEEQIEPKLDELEHGDLPPYDILRNMMKTFGMDEIQKMRFEHRIAVEEALERGETPPETPEELDISADGGAMNAIMAMELCRYSPGMVTAHGVSQGLTGGAIMSQGTIEQKKRWGLDLLTMEKIGSWAITEPGSGSDAFGGMKATAKRTADGGYLLNGSKTFITNGPYADTIIFICKLVEEDVDPKQRKILSFVLDSGMEGLTQTKPLRKMGIHSSPTGELFLDDVSVQSDRLLGGSEVPKQKPSKQAASGAKKSGSNKSGAKDTFIAERTGVATMALGIVERSLELAVNYAKERIQFGQPIAQFQLIQAKLARIEVARTNLQNMVFRAIEARASGERLTMAEASAMKLYAAQAAVDAANDALQVHGGNGYMAEFRIEQLARDARILQIYAGTDEMQIRAIAKDLLSRENIAAIQ